MADSDLPDRRSGPGRTPAVAIVGGGIGGLATAAFLHRAGIASVVYEQATRLTEVGAGIVVAPNAVRLLRRLGVFDAFRERAVRLDTGWEFRRWQDGRVLSAERLAGVCASRFGEDTYTVHRADLLDAIRSAVPAGAIRLGKRCVAVTFEPDGVAPGVDGPVLQFADGETCSPRLVVGADGIHSVVRAAIAPVIPASYAGLCVFRALVAADLAPEFCRRPAQVIWIGPGRHLVHYPVSAGAYINLAAIAPAGDYTIESWSATATTTEFLAEFEGWDPRLVELIAAAAPPARWALLDRSPLQRWSKGTAVLLGDAAHPMFPFFAQGAAQAIEDAAVLAQCIAEGVADPMAALERYENERLPRTTRLQQISHARAHINHLPDGDEQRARDATFAGADPLTANAWIYAYDPIVALTSRA